jgi:mono/diheme cytochrome c family protein
LELGEEPVVKNATNQLRLCRLLAGVILAGGLASAARADEGTAAQKPKSFDVMNTFRNICGFCHEDYGRHAGKGPQLMNDPNSDEFLFKRIKEGLPGRMAAWGSVFTDDQIRQIVKFIRSLKPGEEPKNP